MSWEKNDLSQTQQMIIMTAILQAETGLLEHVTHTKFKIEPQLFLKLYLNSPYRQISSKNLMQWLFINVGAIMKSELNILSP